MKAIPTEKFTSQLEKLPLQVQRKFVKQVGFLIANMHHPSLRAKKYDEQGDLWQARVDGSMRFYFKIVSDKYILTEIKKHPK